MSFESFAHVSLTPEVLAHIWEGEPSDLRKGGHRFGLGREGKTEFPEDWDIHVVAAAVRSTLDRPQTIFLNSQKPACGRIVGQVFVRVQLVATKSGLYVRTAFPVCGVGVIRNVRGKLVAMPLDYRRLEDYHGVHE